MAKNKNPGKETPQKWTSLEDSRNVKQAGQYPNYRIEKTRSGHTMIFDDSKGAESITIQHRGGSAIQFNANGGVQITSHNGLYNVVFGEKRMVVTGAHDITVKGDGSFRVYGNYNKTIHGDINYAATGDFNVTARNLNRNIRGNIDTQAQNETKKLEGSATLQTQGSISHVSEKSAALISRGDQVHVGGASGANFSVTKEGNMTFNNEKGNIHMEAKDGTLEAKIKSAIKLLVDSGAMHLIAQEAANILSKNGNIHMEAQSGAIHGKASSKVAMDAGQIHLNSGESESGSTSEAAGAAGSASKVSSVTGESDNSTELA